MYFSQTFVTVYQLDSDIQWIAIFIGQKEWSEFGATELAFSHAIRRDL